MAPPSLLKENPELAALIWRWRACDSRSLDWIVGALRAKGKTDRNPDLEQVGRATVHCWIKLVTQAETAARAELGLEDKKTRFVATLESLIEGGMDRLGRNPDVPKGAEWEQIVPGMSKLLDLFAKAEGLYAPTRVEASGSMYVSTPPPIYDAVKAELEAAEAERLAARSARAITHTVDTKGQ